MRETGFVTQSEYQKHIRGEWRTIHNLWPHIRTYVPGYGYSRAAIDAMFAGTEGSIGYADAGGFIAEDNANLFWDAAQHFLGVGVGAPVCRVHIRVAACADYEGLIPNAALLLEGSGNIALQLQGSTTGTAYIAFADDHYNAPAGAIMYAFGSDEMSFSTGGDGRLFLSGTGLISTGPLFAVDIASISVPGIIQIDTNEADAYYELREDGAIKWAWGYDYNDSFIFKFGEGIPGTNTTFQISPGGGSISFMRGVDKGLMYFDVGETTRWMLRVALGTNIVELLNRASNGTVEIHANTAEAGDAGDVKVAEFQDDIINLSVDLAIRSQKELQFYDNGNYVGFKAPALSADKIWVLPAADGPANEVWGTDGAGNLIWRTHDELAGYEAGEHFTMLDEDDLVSDSDTQAATQQSIKAYVDALPGGGDVTAAAVMTDHAIVRGDGGAKGIQDSGIIIDDADNVTGMVTLTLPNEGLHILDTGGDHDLIIKPGTDLGADRILTITTGDAARTITLSGNPTLADWFDQAVKQASAPTFDDITVSNPVNIYALSHNAFADYAVAQHRVWEDSIAQDIHADNISEGSVTQHVGAIDHDALLNTHANPYKLDDLAAPDDNTDLDFSTTKHGLCPKGVDLGKFLKDDGTWAVPAGGGGAFTDLTDTPANYVGAGGKVVVVNAVPDALEFVDSLTLAGLTVNGDIIATGSITATGGLGLIAGSATVTGCVTIWDGSNHHISLIAPPMDGNWALVLPVADGPANEALATDGGGNLIWRTFAEIAGFSTYLDQAVKQASSPSFADLYIRSNGELRFYDNGNYVGFKAPALDADFILTLPTADATDAGQVLGSDGANVLGWYGHDDLFGYAADQHRVWEGSIAQDVHVDNIASGAVTQHEGDIDHDALTNYAANQHVVLPGTLANVLSDHDKAAHDALLITVLGSGALAKDHGAAATDMLINVCYGTGVPPAAGGTTEGTLFVKYTA